MFLKTLWILLVVAGFGMVSLSIFASYATREFAMPPRRALQDYHSEWMTSPNQKGLRLTKVSLVENQIPSLIVEPDATGKIAKRGKILRAQLEERKIPLSQFGEVTGQMVLLHGRTGRKEDLLPVAERFCAIGYRCLIPDLPGHGDSKVTYSHFGGNEFDKKLVVRLLAEAREKGHMDSERCALVGISMGGAFAVRAAADESDDFYCATIICSFNQLEAVIDHGASARMGLLAPLFKSMVLKNVEKKTGLKVDQSRPDQWAAKVTIPTLVFHGDEDKLIPKALGEKLYESFGSRDKKWIEVPGAGHSNILTTEMQVFAEIAEWQHRFVKK